jgi:hypothetical protein
MNEGRKDVCDQCMSCCDSFIQGTFSIASLLCISYYWEATKTWALSSQTRKVFISQPFSGPKYNSVRIIYFIWHAWEITKKLQDMFNKCSSQFVTSVLIKHFIFCEKLVVLVTGNRWPNSQMLFMDNLMCIGNGIGSLVPQNKVVVIWFF